MPSPNHLKEFDIVYDPKHNIYTDNSQHISDSKETLIDVGNINFRVIYTTHNFSNVTYDQKSMHFHSHPHCELHIIKSGRSVMIFEESEITLSANDVLLIFPNTYHYYKTQSQPVENSTLSFYFSKNQQASFHDYFERFADCEKKGPGYILIKNNANIVDYMLRITQYYDLKTPLFPYFYQTLFGLIFTELVLCTCGYFNLQSINTNAISEQDLRMQTIQYFFVWHYGEDITLKQLAYALKLSEKQTGRIIKKYYGVDFKTHLSNVRLKNSKRLLKETSMEVRDVATAVGFKSYNGYYIAFKKAFGLTPIEYRKKHLQKQH